MSDEIKDRLAISKYPKSTCLDIVKEMQVGDSVFSSDSCVISGIVSALKSIGYAFTSRSEGDGRRIWRIKKVVSEFTC